MQVNHRILALGFLLIFLSAWVPSSVAHVIDPHHSEAAVGKTVVHEGDHCPYCDLQLSVFAPTVPVIITWSDAMTIVDPVEYVPDVSVCTFSYSSSRAPPVR